MDDDTARALLSIHVNPLPFFKLDNPNFAGAHLALAIRTGPSGPCRTDCAAGLETLAAEVSENEEEAVEAERMYQCFQST